MTQEDQHDGWCVYVLSSLVRNVTYVGCTRNVDRRLRQHNGELKGGAKSTRAARPWKTIAVFDAATRSEAQIIEARIKKLDNRSRLSLASEHVNITRPRMKDKGDEDEQHG